jgi:DNA-binding transcriptional MerR regulator
MTELPLDSRNARRWVPVAEAAAVAGVSPSAVRRWQRSGRIDRRLEGGRGRQLVDLDEVLMVRAAGANDHANVVPLAAPKPEALADAEARAAAAEAEAEELRRRVLELESWIAEAARFEELEQVQLGRLLAHASAEREARRLPLIASTRTLLIALYVLVVVAFVVLLLAARL